MKLLFRPLYSPPGADAEDVVNKEGFSVFWEIVPATSCNFSCLNCYAADNARPDSKLLKWDEMKIALERAIALGVRQIEILGGEPLTYKFLEKFIGHFKNKVKNGFCGVVSNGSLITKARSKSLFNSGLDQISISLDGTNEKTNDANRGKGAFKQTLVGVENIVNVGIPLTIAYTITPFNTTDTSNIFFFVQGLGAKALSVQITEMLGRAKRTIYSIDSFDHFKGMEAICKMYHRKPLVYTEISSRSLFKKFLNDFFNAGLSLPEIRCDGGLKTLMISSGGNLYPCSNYAYFPDGRQKNKGVNLVSDSFDSIRSCLIRKYLKFNSEMRMLEAKNFSTCQACKYRSSCAPCPLANPSGSVPECEWVKTQTKKLRHKILHSKIKLLIDPEPINDSKIKFQVPTQKNPLVVPMSESRFRELMSYSSVSRIIRRYKNSIRKAKEIEDKMIVFLCKLRSHQVILIEGFNNIYEAKSGKI